MSAPELLPVPTPEALATSAATLVAVAARDARRARGRFVVALAGGSTPLGAYHALARHADALDWARTHVVFGDERCVPPDDPASNWRQAHDALLARVPLPPANVRRIEAERPCADAAARYEAELRALASQAAGPLLDLAILGIGEDGHTASLFPGAPALDERERWVVPATAPAGVVPNARITLTLPVLCAARTVVVLAAGAEKREAVRRALAGDAALPAARVRGAEATLWLVDAAARGAGA